MYWARSPSSRRSILVVSSGTLSARIRTGGEPPASVTARSISLSTFASTGPTKSTATCFPRRRSAISIGYAFLMNARRAVRSRVLFAAAVAHRFELGLQAADVALQLLLLGVVDLPAHRDPDQDSDQERDENGSERGNVIAEVEHRGDLQSCSSLAKGVQSGERLPWQRAQPFEHGAPRRGFDRERSSRRAVAVPGSSRISAVNCCWMSRQTRRRSGSTAVITTTPSDSGRLSRPTSPPRATCQRAPSATPRRSGRTEV